ncbi:MAG: hypothetical protein ACT4OT_05950 [Acidobacteriota bacterium]
MHTRLQPGVSHSMTFHQPFNGFPRRAIPNHISLQRVGIRPQKAESVACDDDGFCFGEFVGAPT